MVLPEKMVMDETKPYIRIERGLSRSTSAIRLVMPSGSHVGVVIDRTEQNAEAFDYFSEKLRDGMNVPT